MKEMMRLPETAEEVTAEILAIPRFTEKNSFDQLRRYLRVLGNPEQGLFVVHVAGTNGKGSVTRMLRGLLTASGRKTGGFYSPHLVRINERMETDGTEITDEELVRHYQTIKRAGYTEDLPPLTFFETVFLLAMLFFRERGVTHAVLETGLGGRLDATTSIPAQLYVITQIGMDHEEYLGDTIEKIAGEKAGIITGKFPVIYHTGDAAADAVIRRKAAEMGVASCVNCSDYQAENVRVSASGIDFSVRNDYDIIEQLWIPTTARYQLENAVTAVAAAELLLKDSPREERKHFIRAMLSGFHWEGRLTELVPGFYVDGAHNPSAAERLRISLDGILPEKGKRLIFAASSDKDADGVLRELAKLSWDELWLTAYTGARSLDPEKLMERAEKLFPRTTAIRTFPNIQSMMDAWKKSEVTFTLAAGSLYLVGELKGYFEK